jgi:dihydroneopterin aldolase
MVDVADRVSLHDIRFHGHHGCSPEEQELGQWYSVDVVLRMDLAPAGRSDDLTQAADYSDICRRVVEIGTSQRFALIEALAEAISNTVLHCFPAEGVVVRVRKRPPPDVVAELAPCGALDHVEVEIERSR